MVLTKQFVRKKILEWRKILGIEKIWEICFALIEDPNDMGNDLACIEINLKYFQAIIDFNIKELNEKNIDKVVAHELNHIILEPMSHFASAASGNKWKDVNLTLNESTNSRITEAYLRLYQMNKAAEVKNGHKRKG